MAPTPPAVTRETFAGGLMQAFTALREIAALTWDVGEAASVSTEVTVLVHSEAEVDGAAALLGAVTHRPAGQYRAVRRTGAVTVTVALCAGCAACGHAGGTS